MKTWKREIIQALNVKANEMREISFYDVALELGYKHIKTEDVKDIANAFIKENPTYRAVRFVNLNKNSATQSLFTTLFLTECEYDDASDKIEMGQQ